MKTENILKSYLNCTNRSLYVDIECVADFPFLVPYIINIKNIFLIITMKSVWLGIQ